MLCSFEYHPQIAITRPCVQALFWSCDPLNPRPHPGFEYYSKACRKGDPEPKAVTVNESPAADQAHASEITGLPRDNFEVYEISKAEFEAYHSG